MNMSYSLKKPQTLFPLIRQISYRVTPVLVATPLTANHVTAISLVVGLSAAWHFSLGGFVNSLIGAGLFLSCYILDNCDGEIARIKGQSSEFGDKFDTFVDWVVHAAFFVALGVGYADQTGQRIWLWLGLAGGLGSSINYFIGLIMDARFRRQIEATGEDYDPTGREGVETAPVPETKVQWVMFAFRELSRSDFCFIVLALAAFDHVWLLLPAGAIGAQVYWMMQFMRGARDYHV